MALAGASVPADLAAATAGWVGIALCVAFGMTWAEFLTSRERGFDSPDAADRFELRFAPIAGRAILWLALAAGLASIHGTSAILSASVSTLVLLILALRRRRGEISRRMAGSAAALAVVGVLLASRAGAAGEPGTGNASRPTVWQTSVDAWREFPVFGSGLGTFPEAFRRVQPRDLPGLVDQAPSSAMALLVTGGAIGLALGTTTIVSLLVLLYRAWRLQQHREESALALGAFGALLFWTIASLTEPGSTPLVVSAMLAPVLGTGWSAAQARGGRIL